MFKKNRHAVIAVLAMATIPGISFANCGCVDVSGIVDRGLEERALRAAGRESGSFRMEVKLDSVTLCDGELVFQGTLPDNQKFDVRVPAAKWEHLKTTITPSPISSEKKEDKK